MRIVGGKRPLSFPFTICRDLSASVAVKPRIGGLENVAFDILPLTESI